MSKFQQRSGLFRLGPKGYRSGAFLKRDPRLVRLIAGGAVALASNQC